MPAETVPAFQAISFFLDVLAGVVAAIVLAAVTTAVGAGRRIRETTVPVILDVIVIVAVVIDVLIAPLPKIPSTSARRQMRTIRYSATHAELVIDVVGLLFWFSGVWMD